MVQREQTGVLFSTTAQTVTDRQYKATGNSGGCNGQEGMPAKKTPETHLTQRLFYAIK
jgi:hypothetical protein